MLYRSNVHDKFTAPFLYLGLMCINILIINFGFTFNPNVHYYVPNLTIEQPKLPAKWNYNNLEEEKVCLAKNIYFEARGQILKGQFAVALVTINRVKSPDYPNSICEVVWQRKRSPRSGNLVPQFSWTLDGKSDHPKSSKYWNQSYMLATTIIGNGRLDNIPDFTKGSLFYHAIYVSPYWRHKLEMVATIGDHIFYRY